MKDNKLIELAARAVGQKVVRKVECSDGFELVEMSSWLRWNPLEDDGAALRLAVKLRIDLKFYDGRVVAWFDGGLIGTGRIYYGDDPAAATRRAIVRAAAEIGKSMRP